LTTFSATLQNISSFVCTHSPGNYKLPTGQTTVRLNNTISIMHAILRFNKIILKNGKLWGSSIEMNSALSPNVEKIKHAFPKISKFS
jgi:hypothetical protein